MPRKEFSIGSTISSSTFISGQKRENGPEWSAFRYWFAGIKDRDVEGFQIDERMKSRREKLRRCVRYWTLIQRSLRWSGPVTVGFSDREMASVTCDGVKKRAWWSRGYSRATKVRCRLREFGGYGLWIVHRRHGQTCMRMVIWWVDSDQTVVVCLTGAGEAIRSGWSACGGCNPPSHKPRCPVRLVWWEHQSFDWGPVWTGGCGSVLRMWTHFLTSGLVSSESDETWLRKQTAGICGV